MKKLTILFLFFILSIQAPQLFAQQKLVTISGEVKDKMSKELLPYVNIVLKTKIDSAFAAGTITDESGRFSLSGVKPGEYILEATFIGYETNRQSLFVGSLSPFLDISAIELGEAIETAGEVIITAKKDELGGKMDKKTFSVEDNISQGGGSVLQTMQNLPGVTIQDGKVQLRGNDKVTILIDGKQTALTGFGSQAGLDNIPASSIERIEIINNPSSKYDANGNAGIINIIMKKDKQEGFNGKVGIAGGVGALWIKKENLPSIRPQYRFTPKINPSLSFNYRKKVGRHCL